METERKCGVSMLNLQLNELKLDTEWYFTIKMSLLSLKPRFPSLGQSLRMNNQSKTSIKSS